MIIYSERFSCLILLTALIELGKKSFLFYKFLVKTRRNVMRENVNRNI